MRGAGRRRGEGDGAAPGVGRLAEREMVANRSILVAMKVATGKVVGGKVILEGVFLEEGSSVTVLANDDDGSFELTREQEGELLLSIAEANCGDAIPADEVLAKLARRHG